MNLTQKLLSSHSDSGSLQPGQEIGLRIDQTLTQDATGTLVMLELEAMGIDRVRTELSVQYVDHNLMQADHRNADDHLFLQSACERFGLWYSPPGNGVSHPVHMQSFGKPGRTLLGSDSHTCAAGSLGMLGIGTGGLQVALAMAGEPYFVRCPRVWGVELIGSLPPWVSAKDVILEMLRRYGVEGGVGYVFEYFGPGLRCLRAMDRHVIANMGAELGATTTVFPSDGEVRRFLRQQDREADWTELAADRDATYDRHETIDLSSLEPLIAMPSSPGNVVPVSTIAGEAIYQAYIGSSANPGDRDFAIAALMLSDRTVHPGVSFDINPTSRQQLENLIHTGLLGKLIRAGARLHQTGCNGCIGMGQAPASGRNSLRTTPRNFPGRSGTRDDEVFLCSPETATASALRGVITDPRTLEMKYPEVVLPQTVILNRGLLRPPPGGCRGEGRALVKGPNIAALPEMEPLQDDYELPVLLRVNDDVSTDEILPAGTRVLPLRSNIPKISEFAFEPIDSTYPIRARKNPNGHAIVARRNYGQGSSREHAALATRYLGLRLVLARSFARIHHENLVNFGVLPLVVDTPENETSVERDDVLQVHGLRRALTHGKHVELVNTTNGQTIAAHHELSERQVEILLAGGIIPWMARRSAASN